MQQTNPISESKMATELGRSKKATRNEIKDTPLNKSLQESGCSSEEIKKVNEKLMQLFVVSKVLLESKAGQSVDIVEMLRRSEIVLTKMAFVRQ
jgi:hypothetical protein